MNKEIRTLIILLCAVALTFGSCAKHSLAPEEDQTKVIEFTTKSQASWVKSDEPAFPYQNFGVWGIATKENSESTYVLWPGNQLAKVEATEKPSADQSTGSVVYTPETDAYWFYGYTYSFFAVAPFDTEGLALTSLPTKENPSDNITFTYDISSKYSGSSVNYTFDLLGAAAKQKVETGGYNTSQDLIFWHLFSQIEITNISFGKDAAGQQINGTVNAIRIMAYPSGQYTIGYNNSDGNKTKPTGISCVAITENTNKVQATFTNPLFGQTEASNPTVNIIPQEVADLELYIDFSIKDESNKIVDKYENFKVNLAQSLTEYLPNGKYNWSITIGAKNTISFDVTVSDWITDSSIPEFELK